jgi:phosphotransferase system IIA component
MQCFEQGQHTIGVANELHGPVNGQINGLFRVAHAASLQVNTKNTLLNATHQTLF